MIGSASCTSLARALQACVGAFKGRRNGPRFTRVLLLLLLPPTLAYSAGAQYVYDRSGRLTQVIAPNGASAIYHYDAAGNITSVDRLTSTTPAVTGFSAWSGLPGSPLTIYGSGFSAVPGQNQVTFNGVSATVTSATANALIVTVPAGVTAGTVAVTSSNGTASSSAPFAPSTGQSPPTITSITPRIGSVYDTLTIAGTGFPWGTANNQVTLSGAATQVVGVTPVALQVKPQQARSGRVAVTGTYGAAQGDIDWFAASNVNLAPADIDATPGGTGRMYVDDGIFTPTIATPGKAAMVLIDAVQDEELSLQVTGSTFPGACSSVLVQFWRVFWGGTNWNACARAEYYKVPATGTYIFAVKPGATASGSVSLNAVSAPTVAATVALGDPATTVTTTVPAQLGTVTFPTTSPSQIVSVQITNAQYQTACSNHSVRVLGPPGFTPSPTFLNACTNAHAVTVPTADSYRVHVDPNGWDTGSVVIKIDDAPTLTTAVSLGDPATTVTTTVPAQQGAVTFQTTAASQIVSVQITNPQYPTACSGHTLRVRGPAPATTQIASRTLCASANPYTFPTAGTYTAYVDPNGFDVGSVAIKVDDASTVTYALTLGGSAVAVGTTVPGQIAKATFNSVTANQSVSVIISGSTYPSACANQSLQLRGPSPATTLRGSTTLCSATRTYTLGAVGEYTLTVDPYNFDTGNVSLRVQ